MSFPLEPFDHRTLGGNVEQQITLPAQPMAAMPTYTFSTEKSDASRVLLMLRKHWKPAALFALTVLMAVAVCTFLTKPTYEPVAQLEIDPQGSELFNTQNTGSETGNDEYLGTATKKLRGDELAIAVIRELHLDQAPEFNTPPGRLEQWIAALKHSPNESQAEIAENGVVRLTRAENLALARFRKQLKVERDSTSRIISVSYSSTDPVMAANITNTLLKSFIQMTYAQREAGIAQRSSWLEAQLNDVRKNLDVSTRALSDFQNQTGIADVDGAKNTVSEQMAELARQESIAEAERIQLDSLLKNVTTPDAVTDVQKSPVIQELSKQLAVTKVELKKAEVIYGENHPAVKKLQSEAAELQAQLDQQTNTVLRQLKTNFAAAESREHAIQAQERATSGQLSRVARFNELKKDVETNTTLANDLYRRIKEAGIAAGAHATDMEIVDPARVLDRPSHPNWPLNLLAGGLAGILGGFFLGFLRESFDSRIHEVEDLRGIATASTVSFIPAFGSDLNFRERGRIKKLAETGKPEMYLNKRPRSPEAEAMRSLGSGVMLASRGDKPMRVILVTSSVPREGKSTIAVNFASALSRHGKTCLVDADLRAPKVGSAFGIEPGAGLSELLTGSQSIRLNPVAGLPNLMVLTAGNVNTNASPGELLRPDILRKILDALRLKFDSVVIDTPPLLPFVEARVISTLVDGIILVCRSGVTTRSALAQSEGILKSVNSAPIIEVVMNGAQINAGEYNYSRYAENSRTA